MDQNSNSLTSSELASVGSGELNTLYGVPLKCYCGANPVLLTCTLNNNLGRMYYSCNNREGGGCHIWKWWDEAVKEEFQKIKMEKEKLEDVLRYINTGPRMIGNIVVRTQDKVDKINVVAKAAEEKYEELKANVEEIQNRDWSLEFKRSALALAHENFNCHYCLCDCCSHLDSSF